MYKLVQAMNSFSGFLCLTLYYKCTIPLTKGALPIINFNYNLLMRYIFKTGVCLYALTMAVFKVLCFTYVHFAVRMVPRWVPSLLFLAYLVASALLAAAVGLAANTRALPGIHFTWIYSIFFVILIVIPPIITRHNQGGHVTDIFREVGSGSCAFILSSAFPERFSLC